VTRRTLQILHMNRQYSGDASQGTSAGVTEIAAEPTGEKDEETMTPKVVDLIIPQAQGSRLKAQGSRLKA